MAEYHLLTTWHIKAPLADVYMAIFESLHWPEWWPGAESVEQTSAGGIDGIGSVRRYRWQGDLPYPVVFEVSTTRIATLVAIEGCTRGDLEGSGRWHFSRNGEVSIVAYEWHVRSTRWWMNLLAPIARPMFIRNHFRIMTQGGDGLARRLGARLVAQRHIDLTADSDCSDHMPRRFRESGRISPHVLLMAALTAGTLATIAQMSLWWLAGRPILETLFRDARLTAALLMGPTALPPPATARWDILLVATLIHFALSISYAILPAMFAARLSAVQALLGGVLYGLAIYVINLYGLTLFFPWFSITRDWITLLTHLIFGIVLTACCGWLTHSETKEKTGAATGHQA